MGRDAAATRAHAGPGLPGPSIALRLALAATTLLLSWALGHAFVAAPWVLAVVIGDLLLTMMLRWQPHLSTTWRIVLLAALTAVATAAVHVVPVGAAVPLLLLVAVLAGLVLNVLGVGVLALSSLIASYAMVEFTSYRGLPGAAMIGLIGAATLVSLVATPWHRPLPSDDTLAAAEARHLLLRLSSLAESMDTGFDLPALGDAALEAATDQLNVERAAVIVRSGEDPVIISLHGHARTPWSPPSTPDSVLHRTWAEGVPVRGTLVLEGVRRFVLTVPVADAQGQLLGLIAVDRQETPFSIDDEERLEAIVAGTGPLLEVAILFSRLRARAALEERSRLARDMHDGVAQELAALSFSVDTLVNRAQNGQDVTPGLATLRDSMRQSLGDIRHQISSLRMVERPDVSLGSILGSNIQTLGAQSGMRTTLAIEESSFRFPAHVEVALSRLALDVMADARSGGATFFDMEVSLSPPNARVSMRHDGLSHLEPASFIDHPSASHGEIVVENLVPQGRFVEIVLGRSPEDEETLRHDDVIAGLQLIDEDEPSSTVNEHLFPALTNGPPESRTTPAKE